MLGHMIPGNRLEIDREGVEVIERLPYLYDIKGIHNYLGNVGFYRRFIKVFSEILKPLSDLLLKYVP